MSVGIGVVAKVPTILVYVQDKAAFTELPKEFDGFAVRGRVIGDRKYGDTE